MLNSSMTYGVYCRYLKTVDLCRKIRKSPGKELPGLILALKKIGDILWVKNKPAASISAFVTRDITRNLTDMPVDI